MNVPVFTSAAEILARLKTVHGPGSGLNADLLDGQHAAAFEASGAAASAIAAHLAAANTFALRQTLSAGLTLTGGIRPASDSTTALQLQNAAGTAFAVFDPANKRMQISSAGISAPTATLEIIEQASSVPALKINHATNADVISISKAAGLGNMATVAFASAQSDGLIFTNTDASTFLANRSLYGAKFTISTGVDLLGNMTAGYFRSICTRTAKGTYDDLSIGVDASAASSITTAGVFGYAVRATASNKNITPIYAKVAASPASTDAPALDIVTSAGARMFAIGPTGRIMTDQAAVNTNTPSGATVKALPIYDNANALLGYIPVYAAAW